MIEHEEARLQAEARAQAALEEALARAEAVTESAEAKATQLISDCYRRLDLSCPPTLSDWEGRVTERVNRPVVPRVGLDLFREMVSLQAYYKAKRRGFRHGEESDDWLDAERELLPVYHRVNEPHD